MPILTVERSADLSLQVAITSFAQQKWKYLWNIGIPETVDITEHIKSGDAL